MRYVGYVRISSEDQRGNYSLDAQKRAIQSWVNQQKGEMAGHLVKVYEDEAFSAQTDDRPAFQQMVHDARKGKFDALVVHKFDRLARNRRDANVYKSLLRVDLHIKVFSVTELSEDEDSLAGMLTEGVLELVADWYSKNLSQETSKGKREKVQQGKHNNLPPFGYDKTPEGVLVINPAEAEAVKLAFEWYSTGHYYDLDIARMLNARDIHTKQGKVFSREMVRFMLQCRTYLGLVKYQHYRQTPHGTRDKHAPTEWVRGQQEPIVDEDVFTKCQQVRARLGRRGRSTTQKRVYPLSGLAFCGECNDRLVGQAGSSNRKRYYRCRSFEWGITCTQGMTMAEPVEEQLGRLLMDVKLTADWREKVLASVGDQLGQAKLKERIAELKAIIERLDERWDMGFISKEDYLKRRQELQAELERLQPLPQSHLEEAANILQQFPRLWNEADLAERKRLLGIIIEKVWLRDHAIVAIMLRPSYHIVVSSMKPSEEGKEETTPEGREKSAQKTTDANQLDRWLFGSDGIRTRDLSLDRAAC